LLQYNRRRYESKFKPEQVEFNNVKTQKEDIELILQDPKSKKTLHQYDEDVLLPLKALTNP
jgi:hypothetical protein